MYHAVDADLIEIMSRQSPRPADLLRRASSGGGSRQGLADLRDRDRGRPRAESLEDGSLHDYSPDESRPPRPRSVGRGRQHDRHHPAYRYQHSNSGRDAQRQGMKKRSQSLGGGLRTPRGSEAGSTRSRGSEIVPGPTPTLNLYHVSRPEPRARWVFNLSKHTNVLDNGPIPETITSTIDEKRPNLGGLVWVNATIGGHCCLQKGTKSKTVTPVPPDVVDGWLNGQTGLWWIGALKDGHRSLWDSHVVKAWAMVFIPSSPQVAALNNMEVWRDKCLKGSLRVARPGELARKIADIVTDDQDSEPESVVHTHLCILLAEGDDLELKRPRMFPSTPRGALGTSAGAEGEGDSFFVADDSRVIRHSKSLGNIPVESSGPVDLSQVNLDADGTPKLRRRRTDGEAGAEEGREGGKSPGKAVGRASEPVVKEAMQKVERYRERILILKEDRQAKKAMIAQLQDDLREKEDMFTAENERLRQERNEIKDRAKTLWIDLEKLRSAQADAQAAGMTPEQLENLRSQVDRLRRERNDARADAMRWLEDQKSSLTLHLPGPSPAAHSEQASAHGTMHQRSQSSRGFNSTSSNRSGGGLPNGATAPPGGVNAPTPNERKASAAIAKLKAKVERLRKERDGAEKQAAQWLSEQKEKIRVEVAAASTPISVSGITDSRSPYPTAGGDGDGGAGSGRFNQSGGPVVASLRAESLRLKRELDETKREAKRWKDRASTSQGTSIGVSSSSRTVVNGAEVDDHGVANGTGLAALTLANGKGAESEEAGAQARKALGQLLGQALNLLDPQSAGDPPAAADKSNPSSDTETIVSGAAHSGEQSNHTPTNIGDSTSTASNSSPPTAQLVEVSATLVGGE